MHLVDSTVVLGEAFLSIFEAGSEAAIRPVHTRADVPFERISAAIAAGPDLKEES